MKSHLRPTSSFLLAAGLALAACGDSETSKPDTTTATDATATDATAPDADDAVTTVDADDATAEDTADVPVTPHVTVRYHRADGVYDGWVVDVTGGISATGVVPAGVDDFGARFEVPLPDGGATAYAYQFRHIGDDATDPALAVDVTASAAPDGVWHFSGGEAPMFRAPPAVPGPDQLVVYYLRKDGAYSGWGLHCWQDVVTEPTWGAPLQNQGVDPDLGAWWVLDLKPGAAQVGLIVHKGDEKDPGPDMTVQLAVNGDMVFLITGSSEIFSAPTPIPEFSIAGAAAHWLDADTLAWSPKTTLATQWELRYATDASVAVEGAEVVGGEVVALTPDAAGLSAELKAAYPHLASRSAFTLGTSDRATIDEALKSELVVVARDGTGKALEATRVQIPGVLDALYGYDGPLGVTFDGSAAHFAVWAPTAQLVKLQRFGSDGASLGDVAMTRGADGVWRADGDTSWKGTFYRYQVTVFHPTTNRIETLTVADPYSVSVNTNGRLSQVVDLADPALAPAGWAGLKKPGLAAPEDQVIYEAHIRDFSATDATVPEAERGKYLAFTHNGEGGASTSDAMAHLARLADAGLTTIHVLPSFDFATVDEDASHRVDLATSFDVLCAKNAAVPRDLCTASGGRPIGEILAAQDPKTGKAQEIVNWMRGMDSFNWGYDPVHYTVPEGSYASDPNGSARILEYRQMVKALWQVGLRIALDVVYNHTNQSGIGQNVVLDKVVPGYYHRLNPDTGLVETSTCCANTATEHRMMGRLMVDSVVTWAKAYKIDAFRFDIMGHHMKADMLKVRAALDALTLDQDGVDGKAVYLYGEGWNFGEVQNNARGVNATQLNLAGTGIGSFNDRIRDSVRGGSAFDGGDTLRSTQGFISGLYTDPNELGAADQTAKDALLGMADRITVGMAGDLKTFKLTDRTGNTKTGATIGYNGAPAGYTLDPQEAVNYVEAHDNQTLFDILAYKLKTGTTMADRVRVQTLGNATVLLGQGVPFVHMGTELLRSKSMERDSYDSGDWFNRVDWTGVRNNWNVGLPSQSKDGANWTTIGKILSDVALAPIGTDVAAMDARFEELLAVRQSSVLFRLRTAADVQKRVFQRNVGPSQNPGVLFFTYSDAACAGDDLDPQWDGVAVFINARTDAADFSLDGASGWVLHPALAASADDTVKSSSFTSGTFHVAARTVGVFVRPQGSSQGADPGCNPL